MSRRWQAGWEGDVNGLRMRVVPGSRGPDDLRLEWHLNGGWRPADVTWGLVLADFIGENEDVLHPPPQRGGDYYLMHLRHARRHGWATAAAGLRVAASRPAQQEMFS